MQIIILYMHMCIHLKGTCSGLAKGPIIQRPNKILSRIDLDRCIEKTPKLETYNETEDSDEHVEHIDTILDYHQARGYVKCNLFVLTLTSSAMIWFKGLKDDSIDSWDKLCKEFSSHFTVRKRQPKMVASLSDVVQGEG
ncbi:hypothetical protein A2U01_0004549 [Trifolium medium]|uniref:Retrotransposon gag domain-containing protein n=1 Tax=Trifolium medium TaxID=97028 RepID=A0A392M9A7_9FABA|nr:hypothetical protein [Trifolium medium]